MSVSGLFGLWGLPMIPFTSLYVISSRNRSSCSMGHPNEGVSNQYLFQRCTSGAAERATKSTEHDGTLAVARSRWHAHGATQSRSLCPSSLCRCIRRKASTADITTAGTPAEALRTSYVRQSLKPLRIGGFQRQRSRSPQFYPSHGDCREFFPDHDG